MAKTKARNDASARFAEYAVNPAAFRDDLIVDVDGQARRFGDVMDPWQRDDFAAIDPALMRCNGRGSDTKVRMRAWLERARGHSKTTDIAVICLWALAFAARKTNGYAFAADRDQSALLRDAMETITRLNPWLASLLDVQKNSVANIAPGHPGLGSRLEISTSDVGSSFGIRPDFIVADEICHWDRNADALWHSLISSAAKRNNCLVLGITNSGMLSSWQFALRENIRVDPCWYFSRLNGPVASWMTPERLAEQRRLLLPSVYSRLWLNNWSENIGEVIPQEKIQAAITLKGPEFVPDQYTETAFCIGVDLGVKRDRSSICVLGADCTNRRVRLVYTETWRPVGGMVDLQAVQSTIAQWASRLDACVYYDPSQGYLLAQQLVACGFRCRDIPFVGQNLTKMANALIEAFHDEKIDLYNDPQLISDLGKILIVENENGFGHKIVAARDATGHADSAMALAIGLFPALAYASDPPPMANQGGAQVVWE